MIEIFKNDKDQSQFEKALEEAKKQMSETNKKFADAMKELNKICHLTGIFFLVITSSP